MKRRMVILAVVLTLLLASGSAAQEKVGTGFTYQGFLKDGGSPANGMYDFEFFLFDADGGGNQIGATVTVNDHSVVDGLFTVTLDFGAEPFAGGARWLEISVRPGASTGAYTTLVPRQALSPAPYATYAEHAPWEGRVRVPVQNTRSTVDDGGGNDVGLFSSITIGQDGLGLISYYDYTNGDLMVAHCNDVACTGVTVSTVDDGGGDDVGRHTSVTIGSDGLGLISYYDYTNENLKVAHCNDVACTSAMVSTLDDGGGGGNDVGQYTSVTIGSDGLGLISYYDDTNGGLKVAHCDNVACTGSTGGTLDNGGGNDVGSFTSVTIGADGLGLIGYFDATNGALKVAHCDYVTCWMATLTTVDSSIGYSGSYTSVTIGADGLGLISYYGLTIGLKVAHCNNAACTSSAVRTLDTGGSDEVGISTSVTIGADGLGLISYYDQTNENLKVAHCNDVGCTGAMVRTVENTTDDVGWDSSVTIGSDGLGLISYYDYTNGDLKVAHCVNAFCTPYFRRR
jgi:hypothetical protein